MRAAAWLAAGVRSVLLPTGLVPPEQVLQSSRETASVRNSVQGFAFEASRAALLLVASDGPTKVLGTPIHASTNGVSELTEKVRSCNTVSLAEMMRWLGINHIVVRAVSDQRPTPKGTTRGGEYARLIS